MGAHHPCLIDGLEVKVAFYFLRVEKLFYNGFGQSKGKNMYIFKSLRKA